MTGGIKDGILRMKLIRAGRPWLFTIEASTGVVISEIQLGAPQPQPADPRVASSQSPTLRDDLRDIMPFYHETGPCRYPGLEQLHARYLADLRNLEASYKEGECPPCKKGDLMRDYAPEVRKMLHAITRSQLPGPNSGSAARLPG